MLLYLQMIESESDRNKFEKLYLKYRYLMFSVAIKILNTSQDAEDAVHQAFLYLLENLNKISEIDCTQTRSYIVILTESRAIDIIRKRKRISDNELEEDFLHGKTEMPDTDELGSAISNLPTRYRNVILLKYVYGYSVRETAKLMNCSESAAKSLVFRARTALKEILEKGELL